MLRPEVRRIFRTVRPTNFKLGTQTGDEDPDHRQGQTPRPPRTKVKVARSRDASDRCWPISQERNVNRNNTEIGGKVVRLACNNAHHFQGQRSRSPGRLMLRLEVCYMFRTERPIRTSTLVYRWSTKTSIAVMDHQSITSKVNG